MKKLLVALAALTLSATAFSAQAATVTYMFIASDGVNQSGPVSATVTDIAGGNGVNLTVSTKFGSSSSNFVDQLDFNLNTTYSTLVSGITISKTYPDGPTATWQKSLNGLSAGPNKNLDLEVDFGTSNKNGGAARLDHTETVTFLLTGSGLSASLFNSAVIHAQGLTDTGTGTATSLWEVGRVSAVPLPAALPLFGAALVGLAGLARRRRT